MGVVGTNEAHLMAAHALKPHPGIGLDVLHHVPDVEGRIGVGQGGGDEQAAGHAAILGKPRYAQEAGRPDRLPAFNVHTPPSPP